MHMVQIDAILIEEEIRFTLRSGTEVHAGLYFPPDFSPGKKSARRPDSRF